MMVVVHLQPAVKQHTDHYRLSSPVFIVLINQSTCDNAITLHVMWPTQNGPSHNAPTSTLAITRRRLLPPYQPSAMIADNGRVKRMAWSENKQTRAGLGSFSSIDNTGFLTNFGDANFSTLKKRSASDLRLSKNQPIDMRQKNVTRCMRILGFVGNEHGVDDASNPLARRLWRAQHRPCHQTSSNHFGHLNSWSEQSW